MPAFAANPDRLPLVSSARHPARIHLLADDLTGACDAAAAFLPAGYSVRIWLGAKALSPSQESLQAFNTASRSLTPEQAAACVTATVASLEPADNCLLFKKVDSAARGPLAAELLAAHRALGTETILLAPAFPAAGRTVRKGVLQIEDATGQQTQSALASLFPADVQSSIALLAHPDEISAARQAGKTLLLCDSATQADLEALVRAAQGLPGLLYAGSAGLAHALASLQPACSPAPQPTAARTLVIAGTPHPLTQLQLERLGQDSLTDAHPAHRVLRIRCEDGDAEHIRAAFDSHDPQALILTGGETALLALQALGAHSLLLGGEFAPGIPWGTLQGGLAHGRIVFTKSGGFGSPTVLNDILALLSGDL